MERNNPSAPKDHTMFTPASARAASAYKTVGLETSVNGADSHGLVSLLFTALLQSLTAAQTAMTRRDIAAKGRAIGQAVRYLDEGLIVSLNDKDGGDLAKNLRALYDYCVMRLTQANLNNDLGKVEEVQRLIEPVAQSWQQIRPEAIKGA
jgi:flagellar protein FliS